MKPTRSTYRSALNAPIHMRMAHPMKDPRDTCVPLSFGNMGTWIPQFNGTEMRQAGDPLSGKTIAPGTKSRLAGAGTYYRGQDGCMCGGRPHGAYSQMASYSGCGCK